MTTTESAPPPESGAFLRRLPRLNVKLSVVQTAVGLTAGTVSILGALLAIPGYFKPAPGRGEVVAVVSEEKTEKAVSSATVEILTAQDAVLATLSPNWFGKARHALDEGQYRIRVTHPKFRPEVRPVHIRVGETAEVRIRLRPATASPLDHAGRAIKDTANAVRRFFAD